MKLIVLLLICGVAHSQNGFLTFKPIYADSVEGRAPLATIVSSNKVPENDTVAAIFLISDLTSGDTSHPIIISGFNAVTYSTGQRGSAYSFLWSDTNPLGPDKKPLPPSVYVWMSKETGHRKFTQTIAY